MRIEGPTRIRRTEPFLASPLQPGVAPHGHTFSDPAFREYLAPDQVAYRFDRAVLAGSDGVALIDGAAVPDTLAHLMDWADGSWIESLERTAVRFRDEMGECQGIQAWDGDCLVGYSPAWRNYAHWLQESLPKLLAFKSLGARYPGLRLVLPPFLPGSFHEQMLDLLGIAPAVRITVGHGQAVVLHNAWFTTHADIWQVPETARMAAAMLASAVAPQRALADAVGERVYIHRATSTRRVDNYPAVADLVRRHRFTVVTFEDMPVADQIGIMRHARWIIAEHGAGVANILFCQPGACVLELFNPVNPQPAFWSVASLCGLQYGYLVGDHVTTPHEPEPGWNTPYDIPLDRLETAIHAMNGSAAPPPPSTRHPMGAQVTFTSPDGFVVDGIQFTTNPALADESRLLVYKDRGFIESYIQSLPPLSARRAFEFGIYQGGSAIFLTKLLGLTKLVCIDITDPLPLFADQLARTGLDGIVKPYFNTSQDEPDRIRTIIEAEFPDQPPDLIIDDASHLYAQTKQSFQIAFPYLADGGTYIIEDWSWAHWPENQAPDHGWSQQPAMTNLILELVMLLPSSDMIECITVRQGYVMIRKQASRFARPMLNIDDTLRTRGRPIVQI